MTMWSQSRTLSSP